MDKVSAIKTKFENIGCKSLALYKDNKKLKGWTNPGQFEQRFAEMCAFVQNEPGAYMLKAKANTNVKEAQSVENIHSDDFKGISESHEVKPKPMSALKELSLDRVMEIMTENAELKKENEYLREMVESLEEDIDQLTNDQVAESQEGQASGFLNNPAIQESAAALMSAVTMKLLGNLNTQQNDNNNGSGGTPPEGTPGQSQQEFGRTPSQGTI